MPGVRMCRPDPELDARPPSRNDRYAERAFRDGVPARVVAARCRQRGLPAGRAAQLAEEAAAEAITRALPREFADEAHFRAWITRVALNYSVDLLRAPSHPSLLPTTDQVAPESPPSFDSQALSAALARLSELQRELIEMTFRDRLTLDQIADRVLGPGGGSANARRLRVKRWRDAALKALREILNMEGDD